MEGIIFAIITVLAWGSWIAPSQNVPLKGQQTRTFFVTLAVLIMAIVVSAFVGYEGLNRTTFWFPFLGGLIWAVSGWCAFVGTSRIGMAKAFGIWAPMNIIVSIIWGII
nr:GRP family sugar transporter [Cyclobacteriaceae bacterium]